MKNIKIAISKSVDFLHHELVFSRIDEKTRGEVDKKYKKYKEEYAETLKGCSGENSSEIFHNHRIWKHQQEKEWKVYYDGIMKMN